MSTADADWLTFEGGTFSAASFTSVWLLAIATYGVGDIATTVGVVWFSPGHVEANPVVAAAIAAFGPAGLFGVKLVAFYSCLAIALWFGVRDDDPLLYYLPPACLAVTGSIATVSNLHLLL